MPLDQSQRSSNKPLSINDKFTRVMRQLRQKNTQLAGKKPRGISVGAKINSGLKKGPGQQKENFDAARKIDEIRGDNEFICTELQRFMDNQADITAGNQIHSPMHNRFDSIRDSDVYNSVGSSQGWKSIL